MNPTDTWQSLAAKEVQKMEIDIISLNDLLDKRIAQRECFIEWIQAKAKQNSETQPERQTE